MLMRYPAIQPFNHFMLRVSDLHEIYVEESGNPSGLPVLFVHGGPGAGAGEDARCFFDPEVYRIIVFDQRGAGRSLPHASLVDNTTVHLIEDMELIRRHLKVDRWVLFGGSWGSTLSLAYAEAYPDRVLALILRGIFLCTQEEIDWFYGPAGAAKLFPDYYEDFVAPLSVEDLSTRYIEAYYELLTGSDELQQMVAAKAWSLWEGRTGTLDPSPEKMDFFGSPHTALSLARIECHYFKNKGFFTPNQLLLNAGKLRDIPGILIQGRYDVICPPFYAWQLHQAWPTSELYFIRHAGHSSSEPGITDALVRAQQQISHLFA